MSNQDLECNDDNEDDHDAGEEEDDAGEEEDDGGRWRRKCLPAAPL